MSAARVAAPGPSLLPGVANPSLWLALAILVLSVVASLELVAATAAIRAAVAWSPRLAGSATVAVSGGGLESTEAAAARATEILARAPGVAKITLLDPDGGDALAGRLMGLDGRAAGADPPRLIAAALDGGGGTAATIALALRHENVVAAVDDHGMWTGPVERMAVLAAATAAALLLLLVVLTWTLAAASAGAAVRRRAARVNLLLHLGATETMILGPFRARAAGAAAVGALIGAGAAVALAGAAVWSPPLANWISNQTGAPLGAAPGLDGWDLTAAAIWLPIAVLIALWAASGAAKARLRALA